MNFPYFFKRIKTIFLNVQFSKNFEHCSGHAVHVGDGSASWLRECGSCRCPETFVWKGIQSQPGVGLSGEVWRKVLLPSWPAWRERLAGDARQDSHRTEAEEHRSAHSPSGGEPGHPGGQASLTRISHPLVLPQTAAGRFPASGAGQSCPGGQEHHCDHPGQRPHSREAGPALLGRLWKLHVGDTCGHLGSLGDMLAGLSPR